MFMIQHSYKNTAMKQITLGLCLTFTISITNAADIKWPRTFSGQPDFEFSKEEIIKEFVNKKGDDSTNYLGYIGDLVKDKKIDPFVPKPRTSDIGRSKYSQGNYQNKFRDLGLSSIGVAMPDVKAGDTITIERITGSKVKAKYIGGDKAQVSKSKEELNIAVTSTRKIIEISQEESLVFSENNTFIELGSFKEEKIELPKVEGLPKFSLSVNQLPRIANISQQDKVDLSDFASFLENIITQASNERSADIQEKDYTRELRNTTIQSIVTSPNKYVIINNLRYGVGDRFPLYIKVKAKGTVDIEKLIKAYMPKKNKTPKDLYEQYVQLKENAIIQYKESIGEAPTKDDKDSKKQEKTNTDLHKINVTIKDIQKKKVIISIFENEYPLKLMIAL